MKKGFKKVLSLVLALAFVLTSINFPAIRSKAADGDDATNAEVSLQWNDKQSTGTEENLDVSKDYGDAITMRFSYKLNSVPKGGYKANSLIVSVKGIGDLSRSKNGKGSPAADKADASYKSKDWSYTYDDQKDVYTFTNNKEYAADSSVDGFFEITWTIPARDTVNKYENHDINATIFFPDGSFKQTNNISLTNKTYQDQFSLNLDRADLSSSNGLGKLVDDPKNYYFVKYVFSRNVTKNSRGVDGTEKLIFDPDSTHQSSGAKVLPIYGFISDNGDGTARVSVSERNQYVVVAYPQSYKDKDVTASLIETGAIYEGTDDGRQGEVTLAMQSKDVHIPTTFDFSDPQGDMYAFNKSFDNKTKDTHGNYIHYIYSGALANGTTDSFTINGSYRVVPAQSNINIYTGDDFQYVLNKDGSHRALNPDEYSFTSIILPSKSDITNDNDLPYDNDVNVQVYAVANGTTISADGTPVWAGKITNNYQTVTLPENTTAFIVEFPSITESIKFKYRVTETYHITDADVEMDGGTLDNTAFSYVTDPNGTNLTPATSDMYADETNLGLEQKDQNTYGHLMWRKKDSAEIKASGAGLEGGVVLDHHGVQDAGTKYTISATVLGNAYGNDGINVKKWTTIVELPKGVSVSGVKNADDLKDALFNCIDYDRTAVEIQPISDNDLSFPGGTKLILHYDYSDMSDQEFRNTDIDGHFELDLDIDRTYFTKKVTDLTVGEAVFCDDNAKVTNSKEKDIYDLDGDGNTDELILYKTTTTSYAVRSSGELSITKGVETSSADGYTTDRDTHLTEFGKDYKYLLHVSNGSSPMKNIIVYDILENQTTGLNKFNGTFKSVDLSSAKDAGLSGTVYYANTKNVTETLTDTAWKKYDSSVDRNDVKAIAIDFGDGQINSGDNFDITVTLTAPDKPENAIATNGFDTTYKLVNQDNTTTDGNLSSNPVTVQLTEKVPSKFRLLVTKLDATTQKPIDNTNAHFTLYQNNAILQHPGGTVIKTPAAIDYNKWTIHDLEHETYTYQYQYTDAVGVTHTVELNEAIYPDNADRSDYVYPAFELSNGRISFSNLSDDTGYVLVEDYVIGYKVPDKNWWIIESEDGKNVHLKIDNERKTGGIVFQKSDSNGGNAWYDDDYKWHKGSTQDFMKGAEFGLYDQNNNLIATSKNLSFPDDGEYYVTTDAGQGSEFYYFENIPWGDYTIKELKSPKGYELTDQALSVHIGTNQYDYYGGSATIDLKDDVFKRSSYNDLKSHNAKGFNRYSSTTDYFRSVISLLNSGYAFIDVPIFKDNPDKATITLKKYAMTIDGEKTETPIRNAAFELYGPRNEYDKAYYDKLGDSYYKFLGTYITDENGTITINKSLPYNSDGEYYFKEVHSPKGYKISTDEYKFKLTPDNTNSVVTVYDQRLPGKIYIEKRDGGGNPLNGAEFTLYNSNGDEVKKLTTDDTGYALFDNLEWDNYTIRETKAPAGYDLTRKTYPVTIDENNINQTVTVVDKVNLGTVILQKVSASDHKTPLSGAVYTLYNGDGSIYQNDLTTDGKGQITVEKIPLGNYYFKEKTAPEGFQLSDEKIKFSVNTLNTDKPQVLTAADKLTEKIITVTKKIQASRVNWANEDPIFSFSLSGKDNSGIAVAYNKQVHFTKDMKADADGMLSASIKFTVPAGTYTLKEANTPRYQIKDITDLENGTKNSDNTVAFDVSSDTAKTAKATVTNEKINDSYYSSGDTVANHVDYNKVTVTNFKVEWTGNKPKSGDDIASHIKATVTYNNGKTADVSDAVTVDMNNVPSTAGSYTVNVTYDEGGDTYRGTVEFTIKPNVSGSITFDANGGRFADGSDTNVVVFKNGDIVSGKILTPTGENGDDFKGWYKDKDCTQEFDLDKETVTKSMTVYAGYSTVRATMLQGTKFSDKIQDISNAAATANELTDGPYIKTITWSKTKPNMEEMTSDNIVSTSDSATPVYAWAVLDHKIDTNPASEDAEEWYSHIYLWSEDSKPYLNEDASDMFSLQYRGTYYSLVDLVDVDLTHFDTSKTTNMSYMFYFQESLTNLDVSGFNTGKVTDMYDMFSDCSNLTNLDVSNWDTSKVVTMESMFMGCSNLTTLDVSKWNTGRVVNMSGLFMSDDKLTTLDLSKWDTSRVENISYMFEGATNVSVDKFVIRGSMLRSQTDSIRNALEGASSSTGHINISCDGTNHDIVEDLYNTRGDSTNVTITCESDHHKITLSDTSPSDSTQTTTKTIYTKDKSSGASYIPRGQYENGYVFRGWNSKKDGSGTWLTNKVVPTDDSSTYYAVYVADNSNNVVTLTFRESAPDAPAHIEYSGTMTPDKDNPEYAPADCDVYYTGNSLDQARVVKGTYQIGSGVEGTLYVFKGKRDKDWMQKNLDKAVQILPVDNPESEYSVQGTFNDITYDENDGESGVSILAVTTNGSFYVTFVFDGYDADGNRVTDTGDHHIHEFTQKVVKGDPAYTYYTDIPNPYNTGRVRVEYSDRDPADFEWRTVSLIPTQNDKSIIGFIPTSDIDVLYRAKK